MGHLHNTIGLGYSARLPGNTENAQEQEKSSKEKGDNLRIIRTVRLTFKR